MARNSDNSADHLSKRFGLFIDIYSITARRNVSFKAFLTSFRDNFDTQLEAYTFIGHPQPYRKHKTTERSVEIGLDIPAYGTYEAGDNLGKIALLAQMLHPLGTVTTDGRKIVVPGGDPMFKVRFLNLLVDGNQSGKIPSAGVAKETGVRGYIDNLSYEFVLDDDGGGFLTDSSGKKGFVYPRLLRLNFTFYPFESEALMWIGETNTFTRNAFPYLFPNTRGKKAAEAPVDKVPDVEITADDASSAKNQVVEAKIKSMLDSAQKGLNEAQAVKLVIPDGTPGEDSAPTFRTGPTAVPQRDVVPLGTTPESLPVTPPASTGQKTVVPLKKVPVTKVEREWWEQRTGREQ